MFKKLFIVTLLSVISFGAQAQSIRIFNSCREKSRIVNFTRFDRYDSVLQHYTLGSSCPSQQMPINQLQIGNYAFENLNIQEGEEWRMVVERNGETLKREPLTAKGFWTALAPTDRLTIIIAQKLTCDCVAK